MVLHYTTIRCNINDFQPTVHWCKAPQWLSCTIDQKATTKERLQIHCSLSAINARTLAICSVDLHLTSGYIDQCILKFPHHSRDNSIWWLTHLGGNSILSASRSLKSPTSQNFFPRAWKLMLWLMKVGGTTYHDISWPSNLCHSWSVQIKHCISC